MAPLHSDLRKGLEAIVIKARDAAEKGARAELKVLGVDSEKPPTNATPERKALRVALRARGRQLNPSGTSGLPDALVEEVAYEQWHRMLFARFLAENRLLIHPEGGEVSLSDCKDLAASENEPDEWMVAARYASHMLPGIFRPDDPSQKVRFASEDRIALEMLLSRLETPVFQADDALGWVYQFWQSKKKEEVNKSERKIGGADISPVTQLFTEHYMVRFLLENSLGAWWVARHPNSPLKAQFEYLRFRDDGTPAAGTFPGWPDTTAKLTVMDPCCGSGHFLVAAFEMLRLMRMEEEGLTEDDAGNAVLRDNLFGLELDPRCTQIAAFAIAFAAWKAGGYRLLPALNVACSGIPVSGQLEEWTKLAGNDAKLKASIASLHKLFKDAPDLGSLINPARMASGTDLFEVANYDRLAPLLEQALAKESGDEAVVFGASAAGVAKAAKLLAGKYTLVATNVPYLGMRAQGPVLRRFSKDYYEPAKGDLATTFMFRCVEALSKCGTLATVTPQNWLLQTSYTDFRRWALSELSWGAMVVLGEHGFESSTAAGAFTAMTVLSRLELVPAVNFWGFDASKGATAVEKAGMIRGSAGRRLDQGRLLQNPKCRILLDEISTDPRLGGFAIAPQGIKTGDDDRYCRNFWELSCLFPGWERYQGTVRATTHFGGREHVIDWRQGGVGMVRPRLKNKVFGRRGVAISQMRSLSVTIYSGERFDSNVAPIVPTEPNDIPALFAYCSSPEFETTLRKLDRKTGITNGTFLEAPFDRARWQAVAAAAGPLPEAYSNDPTQWLFVGDPADSTHPLQVAVARLIGYRWPDQVAAKLDALADDDGIVCLPAVKGEAPAADRLHKLLVTAFGEKDGPSRIQQLLGEAESPDLATWLREAFFKAHCALFYNRPFIWHVWDGRKDGFSALVNAHRLDRKTLEKLAYTYLNDWLGAQKAGVTAKTAGAEARVASALELQKKLQLILDGEPPYDIYVRWKTLAQQAIGWNPDLDDGVRMNIRPFMTAEVLRAKPSGLHWEKDGGKNPDGSERLNDLHLTRAEKEQARAKKTA